MKRRRGLSITGSIIFAAGVVLGLAAVAGDTSSPRGNSNLSEFPAAADRHVTQVESQAPLQFPSAGEAPAQAETEVPAPTRSSFMATWQRVNGAIGYRLDVSTSASFD